MNTNVEWSSFRVFAITMEHQRNKNQKNSTQQIVNLLKRKVAYQSALIKLETKNNAKKKIKIETFHYVDSSFLHI